MEKNFPLVFSSPSFGFNQNYQQDFNEDTIIPMSSTTVVEENQYKNDHSSLMISMDDQNEEDHKGFHRKYKLSSLDYVSIISISFIFTMSKKSSTLFLRSNRINFKLRQHSWKYKENDFVFK